MCQNDALDDLALLAAPLYYLSRGVEFSARKTCELKSLKSSENCKILSAIFVQFSSATASAEVLFEFRSSSPLYKSPHSYSGVFG
jgi:hypothetical protein